VVQEVVGSIPISHPKRSNLCRCLREASSHCTPTALYPSGLRGESAKLLFASSNLAEASMKKENTAIFLGLLVLSLLYAGMSYSNVRFTVNTLDPTMIVSPTIVNGDTIITPVPKTRFGYCD
jgi:hypothetical protein